MATKTTTETTHYHIQKRRRAAFIEEWRQYRNTVVRRRDVTMHETAPGLSRGVYTGMDGDRPTRTMDALAHELDPGTTTTTNRHSWDAMVFCVSGWGWAEIGSERIAFGPGDSLHLPAWAWHRFGNDGPGRCRYLTFSCEPLMHTMGFSIYEEAGHTPVNEQSPPPTQSPGIAGDDPYARRLRRLDREQAKRRSGRLHTSWDDLELRNTPRGTRTTFLLDRAIGYQASGMSMAMFELAPGRGQSMHRHPGEAWLYVVEGRGYSFMGTEPDVGENHEWQQGDIIVVDHFLWHAHHNADPDRTAKVVRIHMFDSLLETMRVLTDPLVLFEEPPDEARDKQAGDPSTVDWPPLTRPTWTW
ncbi:MAG: cupin domain-containing protein [Carbonactinosporaceae bacterium]